MDKIIIKKILYIKNFDYGKNLDYLKKFSNVYLKCVMSTQIIDYNIQELNKFIEPYDIIIIGGGPQHLTTIDYLTIYPEIKNQIEIVKLVSSLYKKNKLLIGICLGCQIIGLSFGLKIVSSEKIIFGFNYLDTNTINYNLINNSNYKYLNKLDFKLLAKSFSFHHDYIDFKNDNKLESDFLNLISLSKEGHPYILVNKNLNVYGFQFHPEISFNAISDIVNLFSDVNTENFNYPIYNLKLSEEELKIELNTELEKINKHFFDFFINN